MIDKPQETETVQVSVQSMSWQLILTILQRSRIKQTLIEVLCLHFLDDFVPHNHLHDPDVCSERTNKGFQDYAIWRFRSLFHRCHMYRGARHMFLGCYSAPAGHWIRVHKSVDRQSINHCSSLAVLSLPFPNSHAIIMSGITDDNYTEMMRSVDGDLDYEAEDAFLDDFDVQAEMSDIEGEADEPEQSDSTSTRGLPLPAAVIQLRGRPAVPLTTIAEADEDMEVDWDAFLVEDPEGLDTDISGSSSAETAVPPEPESGYTSFPCLVAQELMEAADTPLDDDSDRELAHPGSPCPMHEEGKSPSSLEEPISPSTVLSDMEITDIEALTAAADVMSLSPPFWPSSDLSDSDDDGGSFANDGWGVGESIAKENVNRDVNLSLELKGRKAQLVSEDQHSRQWVRRGAIDYGK